jgi:hypothetical protein
MNRTTDDLVRITAAGGGLRIDGATKTVDDLVRIVAAGSGNGARVVIENSSRFTTDQLVRIAAAGKGSALFEK